MARAFAACVLSPARAASGLACSAFALAAALVGGALSSCSGPSSSGDVLLTNDAAESADGGEGVEAGAEDAGGLDAGGGPGDAADAGAVSAHDGGRDAGGPVASTFLTGERDRLLDLYARPAGRTRCERWREMSASEQGVFLTISDLLGKRSLLSNTATPAPGADTAISHVTGVIVVLGAETSGCIRCCGDREHNRMYVSADETLISAFRDDRSGLPDWEPSKDPAGPHDPFDQSAETTGSLPRGQAHYFSSDAASVPVNRGGVNGATDPRMIEIDIDYNLIHESSPECRYSGETGRELYERRWRDRGLGGSAELDYTPSGC